MQTIGNQLACLVAISGAQARHDQGVFPQFALRMAASDPRELRHQRFEDADRSSVVTLGERPNAAAKIDGGRTGGQAPLGLKRLHFRQSSLQTFVAGCGSQPCLVTVDSVYT